MARRDRRRILLPTRDLVFRKLLTSLDHKAIPQGLLRDFFDLHVDPDDIRITSPYAIASWMPGPEVDADAIKRLRETIKDVHLSIVQGEFISDMQAYKSASFDRLSFYYAFAEYNSHYDTSGPVRDPDRDRYATLREVYALNVVTDGFFECGHGFHRHVLTDEVWHAGCRRLFPVRWALLELGKRRFQNENQAYWAHFLRTGEALPGAPAYIREAATMIDYLRLDEQEQIMIDLLEKYDADRAAEDLALRNDALEEGRAEESRRIAVDLLALGVDPAVIARATRLAVDEIEHLR
jgi:hypothetical protein